MYLTGPGPHRIVHDNELRDIFFLAPQHGRAFLFSVTSSLPPGTDGLAVTALLRAMLYLRVANANQRAALGREIESKLLSHNDIAIRAKLLSLCRHAIEEPWAYPALYPTDALRRFYADLKPIASASDTVANAGADPVTNMGVSAALAKLLTTAAAFGWNLANYFGGKSKDYYEFYMQRIVIELSRRGIPATSLD